jgi:hypothetical protein
LSRRQIGVGVFRELVGRRRQPVRPAWS